MNTFTIVLMAFSWLSIANADHSRILKSVPDIKQSTDYSCGVASLVGVLGYFGKDADEDDLLEEMDIDPEVGVAISEIIKAAESRGIKAIAVENSGLKQLEEALMKGYPTIILGQAWRLKRRFRSPPPWNEEWDAGHYMIVIGMDETNIYFEDPWILGYRGYIPKNEFLNRWHGPSDSEVPTQRQAIFFESTPDLTKPALRLDSTYIQ